MGAPYISSALTREGHLRKHRGPHLLHATLSFPGQLTHKQTHTEKPRRMKAAHRREESTTNVCWKKKIKNPLHVGCWQTPSLLAWMLFSLKRLEERPTRRGAAPALGSPPPQACFGLVPARDAGAASAGVPGTRPPGARIFNHE